MLSMMLDMGHPVPGTVGLIVKMGVLYVNMSVDQARRKIRRRRLMCKASTHLNSRLPNLRLHISGERYLVH